jgi:hypothetical protein
VSYLNWLLRCTWIPTPLVHCTWGLTNTNNPAGSDKLSNNQKCVAPVLFDIGFLGAMHFCNTLEQNNLRI